MTDELQNKIETILQDRFAHILEDISFRISQVYELLDRVGATGVPQGKVYAEDLNIPGRHFITGYTVTANSPGAGQIAWTDLHMVYNGADTTITNASTANKYAWWSPTTTPAVLQTANTKPNLATGEVLLFLNNAGTPTVMLSDTNSSLPKALADGTVDSGSIIANAVGSAAIADGSVLQNAIAQNAILGNKIANGAVNRANIFTAGAVDQAAIGVGAIIGNKIADGAINRSNALANNIIGTSILQPGAVDANILGPNAVTAVKIADNAVNRTTMLATNVVSTAAIQPNAVTSAEILQGSVTSSKLSILRHILY
jgi:hypothetical protein